VPKLDLLKKIFNYKSVFTITALTFVVLSGYNLIGTNVLSTKGFALSEIENKTLKLEKENHQLSVKIEESAKIKNLEEEAKQRGFVTNKNIVFLESVPTFASR